MNVNTYLGVRGSRPQFFKGKKVESFVALNWVKKYGLLLKNNFQNKSSDVY